MLMYREIELFYLLGAMIFYNGHCQLPKKPHIVLIVADDLGWNDVSWNNPSMITPNLESLARAGVILNQSYVQPICNPSRSALLTGYYPYRLGRQNTNLRPLEPTGLPLQFTLLPEKLRQLGYATHIIGKWHLGFCDWKYTPTYRGFDSFFGYYNGAEDYYEHTRNELDPTNAGHFRRKRLATKYLDLRNNTDVAQGCNGTYSTFLFADAAVDIVSKMNPTTPTFIYLPFQAVHGPLEVPQKYSDMYKWIRNNARRTYCGMVTALDDAVGQIVDALKRGGFWEDTLLIFTTDNGGEISAGGNNFPLRGNKGTIWEGGTRGAAFAHGAGLEKTGYVNENLFHIVDWFPTLIGLAGGDTEFDGDGIDQWRSLSQNEPDVRTKFVYNIFDNKIPRGAVRFIDYKLIVGSGGKPDGWYPPPNYYKRKVKQSAYQIPSENYIKLFNLRQDPNEFNDLSSDFPEVVQLLWQEFLDRSQEMVPAYDPDNNPFGSPRYFGNVWSPGWCNGTFESKSSESYSLYNAEISFLLNV